MSSDINPDVPLPIRCEAISSSTSQNPVCHRPHGTVLGYPGTGRTNPSADDPAFLIGLALGYVRQGDGRTGVVPDTVISRLKVHADTGNPACRLLLDWLVHRNGDLVASSRPDPIKPHRAQHRSGRRPIRERRLAGPGSLKKRTSMEAGSSGLKTAIIAEQTEGKADE